MAQERRWETYEQVAEHLLSECRQHFGLSAVEGKQTIAGKITGTDWEIDAKGVKDETHEAIIVECRRYTTSRLNQEDVGGLAWRIHDTGSTGGIIVSPLALQSGAEKVANATKIVHVRLNPEATTKEYIMQFFDRIRLGLWDQAATTVSERLVFTMRDENNDVVAEQVIIDELRDPAFDADATDNEHNDK